MPPRPSVLVTRRIPSAVLDLLRQRFDVERYEGPGEMPREQLLASVPGVDGLVAVLTDRIDAELLDRATRLRVVANIAVGYDNIDVDACRQRGVVATNTPDVLTEAVADFTVGLMLALTRRIVEGDRLIRRNGWKGWALDFMLGSELRDKQLGIVGFGRIGRAVAKRADAFGMRIAYARRLEPPAAARADVPEPALVAASPSVVGLANALPSMNEAPSAGPPPDAGTPPVPMLLDALLATSDVVSLHVPYNPGTHHLIDRIRLARMKRNAVLINTSRGPVVDEAALAWALREPVIAGAALDVFENEPQVEAALLALENVVLVPHLGSATRETRTAMAELAARNVIAVLSGDPPLTPIT